MTNISAVIITLNEERSLEVTLQALSWCNEIVVVDSGSTDRTLEICALYGCKTFYRKFDGYGTQKQFAVAQASHDWVLALDADEIVTDALRDEILAVLASGSTDVQAYHVPISLVFLGQLIRFGGEHKVPHLRLFNKRYGNFNEKTVHEGVEINGKISTLRNQVLHESYESISEYFAKFNSYTTAGANELLKRGKQENKLQVWVRFPLTFFKIYFLKGCMLDGYPGFVWAMFSALYPVVKYAKMNEMLQKQAKSIQKQVLT